MNRLKTQTIVSPRISLDNKLLLLKMGIAISGVIGIIVVILFLFGNAHKSKAAPAPVVTTIGGVINSYGAATNFNNNKFKVTITNIAGDINDFGVGKKVLVIQMKGAVIFTANNNTYGSIKNYAKAGNYEFATVASQTGTDPYVITFDNLERSYAAAGNVQLVSVPQYESVLVNTNVTALPWNSNLGIGGVVVFEAKNEITLGANITANGAGFKGGIPNPTGNGGATDNTTYFTGSTTGFSQKGEGIANYVTGDEYGRGALANGGGGANTHNAGGGGGSNFTAGGEGGTGWAGAPGGAGGQGLGGVELNYNSVNNRLFMGGGGGGGQQNDNLASSGGNGGGIIIVRGKELTSSCGATYNISADGNNAQNSGGNDGAGGGGGGGVVLMDIMSYTNTCNINVTAKGGSGGTVQTAEKHGGGGGGGSGATLFSAAPSAKIMADNTRGAAGLDCNSGGCTASSLPGYPCGSNCNPSGWSPTGDVMLLPVELLYFKGNSEGSNTIVEWATATEKNNDFFTIERSTDGKNFTAISKIAGNGNKTTLTTYQYLDNSPANGNNYYRLVQTDFDGKVTLHSIIMINQGFKVSSTVKVAPNPFSNYFELIFTFNEAETIETAIFDMQGNLIDQRRIDVPRGIFEYEYTNVAHLKAGIYLLSIHTKQLKAEKIKIIKR